MTNVASEYKSRYDAYLTRIATGLEDLIEDHLNGVENVDRVSARAKDPERFADKAKRLDDAGKPKYTKPLTEIQDQLGVRVIVFYLNDVDVVSEVLHRYLQPIEETALVPDSYWEFGYFGRHSLMAVPADVVPQDVDLKVAPRFFELQIKTLFQHAWSEANHDLGYKSPVPLSGEQQRLMAYAAAQSWGADRAFEEVRIELLAQP